MLTEPVDSISTLINEIALAFSNVRQPKPLDENTDWELNAFKTAPSRSSLPEEFIRENVFNLPLLSAEYVRYYLGEFLIYALNHLNDDSDCVVEFTVGFLNADSLYSQSLFKLLSEDQRRSVINTLLYIRNKFPNQPIAEECEQALSGYWQRG